MGQQSCGVCPALRAQVAQLSGEVAVLKGQVTTLERHIAVLHERLAAWRGAITAAVVLVAKQQDKPTMPLRTLVQALYVRLHDALDTDAGKRR